MTSPIDRSQLANFAVDPGALPVAASCVFPSHSRPSPPPGRTARRVADLCPATPSPRPPPGPALGSATRRPLFRTALGEAPILLIPRTRGGDRPGSGELAEDHIDLARRLTFTECFSVFVAWILCSIVM